MSDLIPLSSEYPDILHTELSYNLLSFTSDKTVHFQLLYFSLLIPILHCLYHAATNKIYIHFTVINIIKLDFAAKKVWNINFCLQNHVSN